MKALLISLSDNYDHQLSLYSLFEEMLKTGLDVYTLGIQNPKINTSFNDRNYFIDAPKRPGLSSKALRIKKLKHVCKLIIEERFDIVYFESLHLWNIYLFKKLKKRTAIIHCIHDVVPHEGRHSFFVKCFNNIIFKNVDCVLVRSKLAYEYCNSIAKLPHEKVAFLPLGRKWRKYCSCQNTGTVLFFGRIAKYKGLGNLFRICKELPDIQFLIVGKVIDKDDLGTLNHLKDCPNVTIDDKYVSEDEMIGYFSRSDCVILPYQSATQSGVIVDSYSFSRPCIAFNVGGINEQIVDGETGFLVNDGISDFEDKITQYFNLSQNEKEEMCKKAYLFGEDNYSSRNISIKMVQLFRKICEDKK